MTSTVVGRRDRKKAQTRAALRRAALDLALSGGYDQLTVEAITEAADVSVRTFFNYFASRDDALLSPDPDEWAGILEGLAARPDEEPPVLALRAVLRLMAATVDDTQALWHDRLRVVRANPELWPQMYARLAAFERLLAVGIAARTDTQPDTDLFPAVFAAAATSALRVALERSRTDAGAGSLPVLLEQACDILAAGLAPPAPTRPKRSR